MTSVDIYRLSGPVSWPDPPETFSVSTLLALQRCPRQWQLLNADYGCFNAFPARPQPKAIEGQIVHSVLAQVFKELAISGMPARGSAQFQECVATVNPRAQVARLAQEHSQQLVVHPRGAGFRLRLSVSELLNQVNRLFNRQYDTARTTQQPVCRPKLGASLMPPRPQTWTPSSLRQCLQARGVLAELWLRHPTIPFVGVLDLVAADDQGVVIVDFKSGAESAAHLEQLRYYAVLWWRCAQSIPVSIEVRYLHGVRSSRLSEADLVRAETEIGAKIAAIQQQLDCRPASALLGPHCQYCDVRQFCDPYWHSQASAATRAKSDQSPDRSLRDLQVQLTGLPGDNGFEAQTENGDVLTFLCATNLVKLLGGVQAGDRLRILNAAPTAKARVLEIIPRTEVFHSA